MIKRMGLNVRPGTILKVITLSSILAPLLLLHHLQISFPPAAHLEFPGDLPEQQPPPQHEVVGPRDYQAKNIPIWEKVIVTAKTGDDDIDWMHAFCLELGCSLVPYAMDEVPEPGYLLPATNQGREAAAYLSYIVDFYNELPAYSIFIHSNEKHWHNDVLGVRTADSLRGLRFEAVEARGFVNLRCSSAPLCPDAWHPLNPAPHDLDYLYLMDIFPGIYAELFDAPAEEAPLRIGSLCCGQFVVTRAKILERPRDDYLRILQWTATTNVADSFGVGFLLEKIWHIIFGLDPIHCPRFEQCRCDLYGWCGPLPNGEILMPVTIDD